MLVEGEGEARAERVPLAIGPLLMGVLGLAVAVLSWILHNGAGAGVNDWVLQHRPTSGLLSAWMILIRDLGDAFYLCVVAAAAIPVAILSRRHGANVIILACVYLVAMGVTLVIKNGIGEAGPPQNYVGDDDPVYNAFPSGHATSATVFYGLALWYVSQIALTKVQWMSALAAAVVMPFLIGTCQVLLGAHWFWDVIAGWGFGAAWVGFTIAVLRNRIF